MSDRAVGAAVPFCTNVVMQPKDEKGNSKDGVLFAVPVMPLLVNDNPAEGL